MGIRWRMRRVKVDREKAFLGAYDFVIFSYIQEECEIFKALTETVPRDKLVLVDTLDHVRRKIVAVKIQFTFINEELMHQTNLYTIVFR